jgi:hypothetical protein
MLAGIQNASGEEYIVSRQPYGPRPGMPLFAYGGFELDLIFDWLIVSTLRVRSVETMQKTIS